MDLIKNDHLLDRFIRWAISYEIDETIIPRNKYYISKLRYLDLSNLELTEVPEEISCLENLEYLYLQNNVLSFLPNSIVKPTNLKELNLNDQILGSFNIDIKITDNQEVWVEKLRRNNCVVHYLKVEQCEAK